MDENIEHMKHLRNKLYFGLKENFEDIMVVNGFNIDHQELNLPNTLNVSFVGIDKFELVNLLKDQVCFSVGSACASKNSLSALRAINCPEDVVNSCLRLSTGFKLTDEEVDRAIVLLSDGINQLLNKNNNSN
eukprot:TRINITY_DN6885_c0_g1_i2.p1 TRINITY_DN6885_c0_g1~~TRINITY_DN6885_c0_g1_i2.p1  ORF type:complete len:132 (+),score=39.79 TRINITY_DN6885_c0_g1_i2:192-587(+)